MEIEESKTPSNNHLLNDQQKFMIIHYKTLGESNKQTARLVGSMYDRPTLHPQTVNSVWLKYLETEKIDNLWCTQGRPSVMEEEDKNQLKRFFRKNPKKSISEAKISLNLSAGRSTINRQALDFGLRAYKAPRKIKISEDNVMKRLEFAQQMEGKSLLYWRKYIFTDESSFNLVNPNGRIFVRRTSENDYSNPDNIQSNNQCESIMIWGAISFDGVGPLVRIDQLVEGESTLNGQRYLILLQRYLLQNYPYLKDKQGIFQQDNAPSHRYWEVLDWLELKNVNTLRWPAQSPDLNIIECVWNEMKFRIKGITFVNKDELWKRLKKEWKSITKQYIQELFESMPRRILAVKKAKGRNTKY